MTYDVVYREEPKAMSYYPHVGMEKAENAFIIPRRP
jgi:hypothetical protein